MMRELRIDLAQKIPIRKAATRFLFLENDEETPLEQGALDKRESSLRQSNYSWDVVNTIRTLAAIRIAMLPKE